jgi:integrase
VTHRDNLYRRSSGIYVLRITIPKRFRLHFGQRELHTSTRSSDYRAAKAVACRLLLHWHSCVEELDQMNLEKLNMSSALLSTVGFISISELSSASGLPVEHLLRETLKHNLPVFYAANAQPGYLVTDYDEVDRESDTGGFVLNSAFSEGDPHTFTGNLRPFHNRNTILSILENGVSEEVAFNVPCGRSGAFFDLPGLRLTAASVLISTVQAQSLFIVPMIKALTPTTVAPVSPLTTATPISASSAPPAPTASDSCCAPEHSSMTVADLLTLYLAYKASCKEETRIRIASMVRIFISLMNNPPLGKLNRELIRSYHQLLKKMPVKRDISAKKHGTDDPAILIELAEINDEPRMTENAVKKHMEKLAEIFQWAVTQQYLKENPAKNITPPVKKTRRDQDSRGVFSDDEIRKIFSCAWFVTGTDKKNQYGGFTSYRPHFYWLPLLGLYTGGRINELSQLYLKDFQSTKIGTHFVSFNKDGAGKVDSASDKSLKTLSSDRKIPLHAKLIDLGLLDYIEELKANKHERLFPELKYDRVKGYGKPASSWFNERFLGKQLGITRDGRKTFHSFRHMFISEIFNQGHPEDVASQLAGHERGESLAARTYRKDTFPDRMAPIVNALEFPLPVIHKFNITDGLLAVSSATKRKIQNSKK